MPAAARTLRERAHAFTATVAAVHRFRRELARHWPALLGALLCSLGYAAARLAEPWPLKFIFDNVLAGMPLDTPVAWVDRTLAGDRTLILVAATVAILALALLRSFFYYHQRFLTSRVGQDVVLKIRRQLFAHLQRLSLRYHARTSTGDLLTRLTGDIAMLRELVVASLLSLVSELTLLAGFVTVMVLMEWRLALVAVLVMPLVFLFVTVYSARIRAAASKQRRREGEVAARLQEVLAGIHLVQMFAREDEEDERLRSLNKRSLRSGLKATRLEAKLNRSVEISVAVGTAAVLWVGATQVIAGRMTPGELIVFFVYLQGFYRPLRRISRVTERASKASTCLERVTEVLDQAPDVEDGSRDAPAFWGEIRLDGISFSYVPGVPVLRNVSLLVEPGQTVALVGPTGAGKSTLLGLIPRLYDPTDGVVAIDGYDVRDFTLKSLREQVSVVPQDGVLFGGDFRENIAYGKPDATDDDIDAAARAAFLHDFITSLPDGYATVVGERGVTLSGGQRQRLAIARGLVKNAPVVLLDEPTTGLDAESERLVLAALDHLLEHRTAIVIAHRLATVQRADVILVMEDGRIVERGTHEELLALGGRYHSLYALQFAA